MGAVAVQRLCRSVVGADVLMCRCTGADVQVHHRCTGGAQVHRTRQEHRRCTGGAQVTVELYFYGCR